jgi:hypothetical protein
MFPEVIFSIGTLEPTIQKTAFEPNFETCVGYLMALTVRLPAESFLAQGALIWSVMVFSMAASSYQLVM